MTIRVSGLFRYPVKSLGGEPLAETEVEARGLAGDRRWMVVDARDRFVTRREVSAMALVGVQADGPALILSHPTLGRCVATAPDEDAPVIEATVWRDHVPLRVAGDEPAAFLSEALGRPVRLAWQPEEGVRPVKPAHALDGDQVSLADGYPLLVTTEASLGALNAELAVPVGMERFRSNLVIADADAWAEDRWRLIRIGAVTLRLVAPCARCVIVTQQPHTGERLHGDDPLTTLRAMGRMAKGGIMFGQNAIPAALGTLRVGDTVEVLEEGEASV